VGKLVGIYGLWIIGISLELCCYFLQDFQRVKCIVRRGLGGFSTFQQGLLLLLLLNNNVII